MVVPEGGRTTGLRSFVSDALLYLPSKAVPAVAGVLGVALYTRLLSPEQYGAYVLTITTVSIMSLLIFGWLNQSALRFLEIGRKEGNLSTYFSTLLISFLTLLGLALVAWYALTPLMQPLVGGNFSLLLMGGGVLAAQAGFTLLLSVLRAERKAWIYSLSASVEALARLAIAVFLLYVLSFGPEGILWGHLVATGVLVALGGYTWFARRYKPFPLRCFDRDMAMNFFAYGLPLVVFSAGELFLSVSDRYILGFFLGREAVGVYSAGYHIASTGISFFFLPIVLAGFPILIQAYHSGTGTDLKVAFDNYIRTFFVVVTPVTAVFMALSDEITKLILGSTFASAGMVMPWVAGGVFFLGLSLCVNKYVLLRNRSSLLIYPVGIATLVNILANILLIPTLGILGAAVATTLAYLLYFLITLFVGRQWHRWSFPWETILKSALASGGAATVLYYLPKGFVAPYIFFQVLLGSALYLISLALLREETLSRFLRFSLTFLRSRRGSQ